MMKKSFIFIAAAIFLVAALVSWFWLGNQSGDMHARQCQLSNDGMDKMEQRQLTLINADGKLLLFDTYIANEQDERAYGYQHICPEVIDKTTMFFVFERSLVGRFHMRNVHAPLDIGFFDETGKLIDVQVMYPYKRNENTTYGPNKLFRYALEAPAGFFRKNNLRANDSRVRLRQDL